MTEEQTAVAEQTRALVPIRVQPPATLIPSLDELSVMKSIALEVAKAVGVIPKGMTAAQAFAVILAGREVGVPPMTAVRQMFVVNGRTEASGQLMQGIVIAGDPTAQFETVEQSAEVCHVRLFRHGRKVSDLKYTIQDAAKAGLAGKTGPWQQFTQDMLYWFTIKRICRQGAPDLLNAVDTSAFSPASANSLMLEVLDPDVPRQSIDLENPELYAEGDDPQTPSPATIESEIIEATAIDMTDVAETPIESAIELSPSDPVADLIESADVVVPTVDGWERWQVVSAFLDCGREEGGLQTKWFEVANESGLTAEEALTIAKICVAEMEKSLRVTKKLGVSLAEVNPLGRLVDAANRKRDEQTQPASTDAEAEVGGA